MAIRSHRGYLRRCRHDDGARPEKMSWKRHARPGDMASTRLRSGQATASRVPVILPRVSNDWPDRRFLAGRRVGCSVRLTRSDSLPHDLISAMWLGK